MDETMRNAPIGDDGRYMTKARVRLHRLLNGLLVWAIVCIVAAVSSVSGIKHTNDEDTDS